MKSCSSTGRLQHRDIIFSSLFFSLYLSFFFKLHRETRHRGSAPSTGEWDEDGETRWGGQKYIKARALYDYSWDWSGRRARRDVRFVEGRKKAKESGRKKERRKKTTSFTAQSAPCLQIAPGLFVVGRWYDCRMQRSYDGQTNSLSLLFVFFFTVSLSFTESWYSFSLRLFLELLLFFAIDGYFVYTFNSRGFHLFLPLFHVLLSYVICFSLGLDENEIDKEARTVKLIPINIYEYGTHLWRSQLRQCHLSISMPDQHVTHCQCTQRCHLMVIPLRTRVASTVSLAEAASALYGYCQIANCINLSYRRTPTLPE